MSDIPALLQPLKDRLARRDALVERGEHRRRQSRCADPERTESQHYQHPANVTWETVPHPSYVSHLEALSDRVPQLIATIEGVSGPVDALMAQLVAREERWKAAWESGELTHDEAVSATQEDRWAYGELAAIRFALTQALGGDTA